MNCSDCGEQMHCLKETLCDKKTHEPIINGSEGHEVVRNNYRCLVCREVYIQETTYWRL